MSGETNIQLTDALLSKLAGWEAMKEARGLLAAGRVLDSNWEAPRLHGSVQEGSTAYRAGLVIRSASDADNLCTCRISRQRGLICAHSVAIGLHCIQKQTGPSTPAPATATPVTVRAEPLRKEVALARSDLGEALEISVILPPDLPGALAKGSVMLYAEGQWSRGRSPLNALPMDVPFALAQSDAFLLDTLERFNRGDTPGMLSINLAQFAEILPLLNGHPRITIGRSQPFECTVETAVPKFKLHLAGGLAILEARLECFYNGRPAQALPPGPFWVSDSRMPLRLTARDLTAEQSALSRLARGGFNGPDTEGKYHLRGQDPVLKFFARDYPGIEKEWEVTLEERLEKSAEKLERVTPHFQITPSGEQWFDMQVTYEGESGQRFSSAEIQRLLRSGQSHAPLANGKFALLDTGAVEELEQVLVDASPQQHSGVYRLSNAQAGFIDATLSQQAEWRVQAPVAWRQKAAVQRGKIKLEPPPMGALESLLRPYQKDGVAWLRFLRDNRFGGILADEMGLGKTFQVLAHLDLLDKANRLPSLIVCPTSLVFNWEAEAAKFVPQLHVLALHGAQRQERFAEIPRHDVIVTSYALLRRDAVHYAGIEFDTVILDEAQHIKNRQTQNAQAVKSIRGAHRLVLTGTPLENSVLDLWSIFDFLMPGYLGSAQDFRERYETSIVRDKDSAAQARLSRRLRPFMLRRLKRDVAADLPEKIEQVSYCELNEDQRALYQQLLETGRREMLDAASGGNQARGRMLVLTTLLRLRQICCDARLLKLDKPVSSISGKTELFLELLEEVIDGGHRVLVFSQFTSMLGLLRDELAGEKIEFCYLDGATKDRSAVVDKFQRDAAIPVFLISLKAGGTGLNLTGADTVIHFDPWWNPAVEAQATDRAHRIGQKKVVTSYKLITRGTVEEKILNLQARKRALTEAMLGDEEQFVQNLSWEEIQELLAP
jgi:superfamily II DNA or RNA helicase